jgi:hypothetical protein
MRFLNTDLRRKVLYTGSPTPDSTFLLSPIESRNSTPNMADEVYEGAIGIDLGM